MVLTTPQGNLNGNLAVPATLELNGASVFAQILGVDTQANAFGIVTSNAVQHQLLANFSAVPVSKVQLAASLGATGTSTLNSGYVVQFD